eukprot:793807-Amphidinium_carterae.1
MKVGRPTTNKFHSFEKVAKVDDGILRKELKLTHPPSEPASKSFLLSSVTVACCLVAATASSSGIGNT